MNTNQTDLKTLELKGTTIAAIVSLGFLSLLDFAQPACQGPTAKLVAGAIALVYLFQVIRSARTSPPSGLSAMGTVCIVGLSAVVLSGGILHGTKEDPSGDTSSTDGGLQNQGPSVEGESQAPTAETTPDDATLRLVAVLTSAQTHLDQRKPDLMLQEIEEYEKSGSNPDKPMVEQIQLQVFKANGLAAAGRLPEAQKTLEEAIPRADADFADDELTRNVLVDTLANVLFAEEKYEMAVSLITAHMSVLDNRKQLNANSAGHWFNRVGQALGEAGKLEESIDNFNRSIEAQEQSDKPDPTGIAMTRLNLALSLSRSGKMKEAKSNLETARKSLEKDLPEDHPARKQLEKMATAILAGK